MTMTEKATVLIVDDCAPVAERVKDVLKEIGAVRHAVHVTSAASARRFFSLMRPDVVILDVALPDGNGIALAEEFKRDHPACVVIVLTNYVSEPYRRASLEAGADHFLDKSREFLFLAKIFERWRGEEGPGQIPA